MRNNDYFGNRGEFQGQRRDRDQSATGRGMDRLGQMGRNLMGGMRRDRDDDNRFDQRRYADDFEGRNRYTEWQNRYSLNQGRSGMQPNYGQQDRSQFGGYGERDRFGDVQGRYGVERFDEDDDFSQYDSNDRMMSDDFDRYNMDRSQSNYMPMSEERSSSYNQSPSQYGSQQFGSQQYGGQQYGQQYGQGFSSQYSQNQPNSMGMGRSSQSFDRDSSAFGARAQSMFAGRGPRGYQRSDDRIMEDVCEALMHHPQIDASDIEVKVNKGEVILSGSVDNRQAKRISEDIIEQISGVREVKNELRVSSSSMGSAFENRQNQTTSGLGQSSPSSLGQAFGASSNQTSGISQSSSNQSTQGGSDYNLSPMSTNMGTSATSSGTTGTSGATSAASGRASESKRA